MPGQSTVEMPPEVLSYLDLHHIITLGTASFTGMPRGHDRLCERRERGVLRHA